LSNILPNVRKPVPGDAYIIINAKLDSIIGRKISMSAVMKTSDQVICADASTLFVSSVVVPSFKNIN
jgi:hypothetical protein